MQNELYLLIGALIGFIYTMAVATIVLLLRYRRKTTPSTLGNLRKLLGQVQNEIRQIEEHVWNYGTGEEEKAQRWRISCGAVLGKAVSALQSCWYGREQDSTSQAIYDELLVGLKSVGLAEIKPNLGQEVEENDRHYRIKKMEGVAPYKVSKLLCPGYLFKPTSGQTSGISEQILLEPALIEVTGDKLSNETNKSIVNSDVSQGK